jgi:8-oxo-dGTP pyrophosphatase MutT (NUDIX family)
MCPDIVQRMPWPESSVDIDHASRTIQLLADTKETTSAQTNAVFDQILAAAIDADLFDLLNHRHSEHYRIIGSNHFVQVERFAHALFGIAARGAHMTAYVPGGPQGLRIWVARRSKHLFTYPGKLDSIVAGGVKASDNPVDCIVAEAMEEASLPEPLVSRNLEAVGTLTYVAMRSSPSGREKDLISPEVLYLYDMKLPDDVILRPNDDEVETFHLMTVQQVQAAMAAGEFKTNSAVVMIDFFIRHGIITQENEPNYIELISRMHRRLPVAVAPMPSK